MGTIIKYLFLGTFAFVVLTAIAIKSYSLIIDITDFFIHSIWGWIAIVCLILSVLLFYASSKTYSDINSKKGIFSFLNKKVKNKNKNNNLVLFDNSLNQNDMDNSENNIENNNDTNDKLFNYENVNEIDLSRVSLEGLVAELAQITAKPSPIFFKGWGNRRLQLDIDRINLIRGYIESLRAAGNSFIEFQSDAVLSFEKVKNLTEIKSNTLKLDLAESKLRLDLVNVEYETKMKDLKVDVDLKEAELKKRQVEIEDLQNQAKERAKRLEMEEKMNDVKIKVIETKVNDESRFNKSRSELLDKIVKEMDMNNINPSQAFILINALAPGANDDLNFQTRADLIREELEKMKAENRYKTAEAKEREAQADEATEQSKYNIHNINRNKEV